MSRALRQSVLQDDFSTGMWRGLAPHLIPRDGAWSIRNGILTDDGVERRGGTVYRSDTAFGSTGLTFLTDTYFKAGQRTFFASKDDFGVLDTDDESPINLGGDGLTFPVDFVSVGGLLWIGGGYLYGGARIAGPYSTGTATATNGSTAVTGAGTSWAGNVGPGSIIQFGTERVYVVESVGNNTSLTLTEPYQGTTGSGKGYEAVGVYKIDSNDPYPDADFYAVVQDRLCWAVGNEIRFAPIGTDGKINNHAGWVATDFWRLPEGVEITGLDSIGGLLLSFTTQGIWTLSGLQYAIVDANGAPQHRLDVLSREINLWGPAGVVTFEQRLVVPATDGVYFIDGISSPVLVSEPIAAYYTDFVRRGYRVGQAAVFRGHYLLPILDASGVVTVTLVSRLDRAVQPRRGVRVWPWTFFDGDGGRNRGYAVRVTRSAPEPTLLGAQAAGGSRVVDCMFFSPRLAYRADGDATAHELEIITRDFSDGRDETLNVVRAVRARYEMSGAGPELDIEFSDGAISLGGALWGQVRWGAFKWGGAGSSTFRSLCTVGVSDGRDPHRCPVNRQARFFRYRLRQSGEAGVCRIKSIETEYRPSRAVRR